MATFRKVNTDYWEDDKVVDDFTPEDRYFMLYLMTNPHTNQSGCYPLTIRQMEFETGYNKDTILKLLKRFTEILEVILYDENTKEVLIKNWHKYNWTSSPKVIACILKEVKSIKSNEFKNYIDTLFIEYGYAIDTLSIQKHNKNKNKNKEEEREKEEDEENDSYKLYGEYSNIYLSSSNYGKLLAMCASEKILNQILDEFSGNIEIGKEEPYKADFPNAHFERLRRYYNYRKQNPNKFIEEKKEDEPYMPWL